eukprot:GFYU01014532.1.p1 GENE.GFYU01014532.1~~GFYU01014532.1.p1  ORF type:complete len:219 (+),score=21.84 GFYU01014532.1:166-822(+)
MDGFDDCVEAITAATDRAIIRVKATEIYQHDRIGFHCVWLYVIFWSVYLSGCAVYTMVLMEVGEDIQSLVAFMMFVVPALSCIVVVSQALASSYGNYKWLYMMIVFNVFLVLLNGVYAYSLQSAWEMHTSSQGWCYNRDTTVWDGRRCTLSSLGYSLMHVGHMVSSGIMFLMAFTAVKRGKALHSQVEPDQSATKSKSFRRHLADFFKQMHKSKPKTQ